GEDGARRVVVNSTGREMRMIDEIPPTEGRRVQLTVDYDLQKAAEDGFRNAGFNGAALIMDPRNGEVLTYTSLPSYDPNDFAAGIDRVTWASLNTDKLRPLQNRVLQGRYSPGAITSAISRAGTVLWICATRSRSRATSTSTRSATCSASTRFTSGRRSWGSPGRPASICRTSRRASFRTPSGSSRGPASAGTRARQSLWRSARGRCR